MPRLSLSFTWGKAAIGLAATTFLVPLALGRGGGQPAKLEGQAARYLGSMTCERCHTQPGPRDSDDFVLLTEYKTWKERDKHSQAYQKLTEPRAQRMGEILRIDVTKAPECLNCHATNVRAELREQSFDIKDGVSCDACHGPSEKWLAPHLQPKWRTTPMAEKEALGMIDVRDPVKRARMCLSCHIGNAEEGKVVTHAMYAAGHPPLPGVEIATFSHEQPRHWRYMSEKKPEVRKVLGWDDDRRELTELAIVSGVVSLRESAALLAAQAKLGASDVPDKSWPELTHFDCYACHHDLKVPSWRQARGYPSTPGRPQMKPWPLALARVAARFAGQDPEQLDRQMERVYAALDAQPYGKAEEVAAAAQGLVDWCDGLVKSLREKKFDNAAGARLLADLVTLKPDDYPDYDSARQLAWAIKVLYGEQSPKHPNDAQIAQLLDELNRQLKLGLPSGTGRDILKELAEGLQKVNDYDPEEFKSRLGALRELLEKK